MIMQNNWITPRAQRVGFLFVLTILFLGSHLKHTSADTLYWDNDTNAANNNTTTGAGLGGTGTWDASVLKWFNSTADVAWTNGSDAVFWGSAGSPVTLNAAQTANSVTFKTTGYVVQGTGGSPPA